MSEKETRYLQTLAKVDALIVLGRNFQPGYSKKTLIHEPYFLSPQSRINAEASGEVFIAGIAKKLVLVGGHTAGSNVPAEAEGLKSCIQKTYPQIPESAFLLEVESIETEGNAKKTRELLEKYPELKTFGIVSDPSHLVRAVPLFRKQGIDIEVFDSIAILQDKKPQEVNDYIQSELYKKTIRQDQMAQRLQTFPLLSPIFSWVLYKVALHQRNPNTPNPYVTKK